MTNQIHIIKPFVLPKTGMWVYNDQYHGFYQEPIVAGADDMLDVVTAREGIKDAELGFTLVFSDGKFPTGETNLYELKRSGLDPDGGTWYRTRVDGHLMHGWLCPGLLKYFDEAPEQIYVAVYEQSVFAPGPAQPVRSAQVSK